MSTIRIEVPDAIHSLIDKIPDLENRIAYYESIYPDLPSRYAKTQKDKDSEQICSPADIPPPL